MKLSRVVFIASFLVLASLLAGGKLQAQPKGDSCATCHLSLGVERLAKPVELYKNDIHAAKGFGCVSCHGGDATRPGMDAMDKAKGFIGKPTHTQVIEVCGRCHSDARFMRDYNPRLRVDQVAEYFTSVHGRRLKELNDQKVATCASCHVAHSIRPASDTRSSVHPLHVADTCGHCHADAKYMAPYKIPTDQLENYKKSIHWQTMSVKGDLSAPTCNDCHGNHGAAPPGVSWVGNVCGQCHVINEELFSKSLHSKVFVQLGTPGCATCHSNHDIVKTSDSMLGVGDNTVCARCHTPDSPGGKIAAAMRASIDKLRESYENADSLLQTAEHAGMEVSQPLFELNDAKTELIKARTAIHSFHLENVNKQVKAGLEIAQKAHKQGVSALQELQFRRKGLAVSALIIAGLVAGLIVKIRQMEKPKRGER